MSLLDEYAYSAAFEAGKKAIIDDYESDDLSKIGLTRLPKDADGVLWTGKEAYYIRPNGIRDFMQGLILVKIPSSDPAWFIEGSFDRIPADRCCHFETKNKRTIHMEMIQSEIMNCSSQLNQLSDDPNVLKVRDLLYDIANRIVDIQPDWTD